MAVLQEQLNLLRHNTSPLHSALTTMPDAHPLSQNFYCLWGKLSHLPALMDLSHGSFQPEGFLGAGSSDGISKGIPEEQVVKSGSSNTICSQVFGVSLLPSSESKQNI